MSVPFEKIGPGQSGRWVYQVLGSNGPIPNPQAIRYLASPPGAAQPSPVMPPGGIPDLSALVAFAQLANLGLSVANLAVSTATLIEVRKQTRMLREMQTQIGEIRADVSQILERVIRIDIGVAEGHFRESIRHALRSSTNEGEINLVSLAEHLSAALDQFEAPLGSIEFGRASGLRLSTDVRELSEACLNLLWTSRRTALSAHNLACGGDAGMIVRDESLAEEIREVSQLAAEFVENQRHFERQADEIADKLRKDLKKTYMFTGSSEEFAGRTRERLRELEIWSRASQGRTDDAHRVAHVAMNDRWPMQSTGDSASTVDSIEAYLHGWAAKGDACLIMLLRREVAYQQDPDYWAPLEGWARPINDRSELGVERRLPVPSDA